MARGIKRRTMVFVDGSALRDTLKVEYYRELGVGFETKLDYFRLGQRLCHEEREFIRLNYYTATPAYYTESAGARMMGSIELSPFEVYSTDRVMDRFLALKKRLENSRNSRLVTGRLLPSRLTSPIGPAVKWAFDVIRAAEGSADVSSFLDRCLTLNQDAKEARLDLFRRISQLYEDRRIPPSYMNQFSSRMATLAGEPLQFREKGVDTALAVEMLELCMHDALDDAVLFAVDEDYVPLVEAMRRTGRLVTQAFVEVPNNPGYGYALRSACDDSLTITLAELQGLVANASA